MVSTCGGRSGLVWRGVQAEGVAAAKPRGSMLLGVGVTGELPGLDGAGLSQAVVGGET